AAQPLPANPVFYTSHPLRRPSLDFYSGYPVIPIEQSRIERQWRKEPSAVMLITTEDMAQLKLNRVEYLGQVEDWLLIRRKSR
ncbi:MAG: hypothetical protein VKJ64_14765, partial [Leptolyngbyaceae bacterium]|nr:hypothetical protein [Leptolyngbyaceae bacterium]